MPTFPVCSRGPACTTDIPIRERWAEIPTCEMSRPPQPTAVGPAPPFTGFLGSAILTNVNNKSIKGTPSRRPLASSDAARLYTNSLTAAAAIISHANVDSTVQRRLTVSRELQMWLERLPPEYPRDLTTCRPEEILVFMQSHYIQAHVGSRSNGQPLTASPSGVATTLSHLSTTFTGLGRQGPYDRLTGKGNPCESVEITRFKQGYHRDMVSAGYQETSAVPSTLLKVEAVVNSLSERITGTRHPLVNICSERDALLLLYSWDSGMRGKDGGSLTLMDLTRMDRTPIFPSGYDSTIRLPPEVWILPTHGTKTNKRSRNHQEPIPLKQQAPERASYCFLRRLWVYLAYCQEHGHPITHYLFRPLGPDRLSFKEAPTSSSSFNQTFKTQLKALGIYNGETPHGLRRGTLQATASSSPGGVLAAALQGQIRTPSVLKRYLDPHRHEGRAKWQRS